MNRYDYEPATEEFMRIEYNQGDDDWDDANQIDCYRIIDWKAGGSAPFACAFSRDAAEKIVMALNGAVGNEG